jgi:dihydrosphingosine 1-phosphate phosphatase
MPKSKLYMSHSADDAASPNGDGAARGPTPIRKEKESGPNSPKDHTTSVAPAGRLPEEVYTNMLPWWRAALRRKCVAVVEWESEFIGEWQVRPFCPFFAFNFFFLSPFFLGCSAVAVKT